MKRTILIGLLAVVLLLALGCTPAKPAPSPSPLTPTAPLASPSPLATTPPAASASPAAPASPSGEAGGTGGTITGFEEGKTVKESELPQKVADAIKKAYTNVKIKTITYVTYMNDQVYHVVLEEPAGTEKVEQFYIKADGTIVPYEAAAASPSPKAKS